MFRVLLTVVRTVTVLLLIAGPVVFALHRQTQTRNFRVVRAGVLYRSGQMTLEGLQRIIHDYHIRTVVNLREGVASADKAEEDYCEMQEINFVRIPPRTWSEIDGVVPVEEGVRKFKEVMSDAGNYPVLVHCMAGIHRTGAYCAIYRMELEHWSNERALAEMRACGYTNLDDEWDILGYLEQYRPHWAKQAVHAE
jgi:protein tyrosine/serine phosphatase